MSNTFAPVVNDPLTNGHVVNANNCPTDDQDVRKELRKLGEPITLFGEREVERRERLLRLLSEQRHTDFGIAELERSDDNLMEHTSEEEVDEEEFYTPGLDELLASRKYILETSVEKAARRLKLQKQQATDYDAARTLKNRRHINSQLGEFELNGTYTLQGNTRTLSGIRVNLSDNKVACGSWDGNFFILERGSPDNFKQVCRLAPGNHTEKVTLAWSPDEEDLLVSGGAEGTLNVWKVTGESKLKPSTSVKQAHSGRIAKTEFHPSGKYITTTSHDQTWKMWDLNRMKDFLVEQEGHDKEVCAASFHPDGSILATGGLDAIGRIWDLRSGRSIAVLQGHIKGIYSMDWSPNGYHLASASGDCSVKIWDMRKTEAELFSIPAHTKLVSDVRFLQRIENSPLAVAQTDETGNNPRVLDASGSYLATSSFDGTVKLWSADNWVAVKTLRGHTDKVTSCDISRNGLYVVSCGWDRVMRVWSKLV